MDLAVPGKVRMEERVVDDDDDDDGFGGLRAVLSTSPLACSSCSTGTPSSGRTCVPSDIKYPFDGDDTNADKSAPT